MSTDIYDYLDKGFLSKLYFDYSSVELLMHNINICSVKATLINTRHELNTKDL